jgi:hypothetical protein
MIELNGVANIHLLVDQLAITSPEDLETFKQIKEQLVLLERYMLAVADHAASIKAGAYGALIIGQEVPFWHEVRENPEQYPTGRERMAGMKRQMEGAE